MNILYIHQYFVTPEQSGATRSYWISKELIKNGHKVTMLTSRNTQEKRIHTVLKDGIKIIYIKNPYSNKMSAFKRTFSFLRFMIISSVIALKQRETDLIYATSTPLSVGFPALLTRLLKKIPYIFEVRDLWPEFPIQIGVIKSKFVKMFLRFYERKIYEKAIHIIALSPGMKDGIVKAGIGSEKVTVIPNMSKIDNFFKRLPDAGLMGRLKISSDKFKIIHFGAMGVANGLEYIVAAAKIIRDHNINDIEFILLGDGMVKDSLKKEVVNSSLDRLILFIDKQPMHITSEIVNLCNCSVVTFRNLPILQTNSPNKLFDSLSAGVPVIVNSAGWTKDLVEENQCGFFVDPEKPDDLVKAVLKLKNDKELAILMGKNARSLAENKFDKSLLCPELVRVIEDKYMNYKG